MHAEPRHGLWAGQDDAASRVRAAGRLYGAARLGLDMVIAYLQRNASAIHGVWIGAGLGALLALVVLHLR